MGHFDTLSSIGMVYHMVATELQLLDAIMAITKVSPVGSAKIVVTLPLEIIKVGYPNV